MTSHPILRAAAEAATAGEWSVHSGHYEGAAYCYVTDGKSNLAEDIDPADATYIAAANPAVVIALLDELDASRAENERLRVALAARVVDECIAQFEKVGDDDIFAITTTKRQVGQASARLLREERSAIIAAALSPIPTEPKASP